jgi:uncharacterized membrane protein YphA (DoxX/SURF4 family)
MNSLTRVFLVFLRLAIGWHFLVEGWEKIYSVDIVGPTETNRPWTSRAYLREATGPAGDFFRSLAGDPDAEALELFTVGPLEPGQSEDRVPLRQRISPLLDKAWNEYFDRFVNYYQLSSEPRVQQVYVAAFAVTPQAPGPGAVPWAALAQAAEEDPIQYRMAQAKLNQAKDQAVRWLLGKSGSREVERVYGPQLVFKVTQTPDLRLKEYRDKVEELRRLLKEKLPALGQDVEKKNINTLKAEVNQLRTELLADLERPMKETLEGVLTDQQKKKGPIPPPPSPRWSEITQWSQMEWIDRTTRYGLTAVGICLLLGLFTRSACVGGAAFLLLFYLALPALPWVPENPRAEGHYLFINKNIIEMLALLTLATTRSGFWAGLDGLVYCLLPWHWRGRRQAVRDRNGVPVALAR